MSTDVSFAGHHYRVVVALDDSEYAEIVLEHALDQASRHESPELHVMHVAQQGEDLEQIEDRLARFVREGLATFRVAERITRLHVRTGQAADEIANLVAEVQADLLVIGRYGLHHPRRSTADAVIAMATCPTLVVGLTDHPIEAVRQCPACVAVRAHSGGESWFCRQHTSDEHASPSRLLPWSGEPLRGGSLW